MNVKKRIGKSEVHFQVEGNNVWECQMEAQKLSFGDITKCALCGSDNLELRARLAQKKFKYVDVSCKSCRGSLTFGCTVEDPNTFYLRKNKETKEYDWKPFNPEDNA